MIEVIETAPEVVTPEKVTPLKPSEALRLGRLTSKPCKKIFFGPDNSSCAVGAIAVGYGMKPKVGNYWYEINRFLLEKGLSDEHLKVLSNIPHHYDNGWDDDDVIRYLEFYDM